MTDDVNKGGQRRVLSMRTDNFLSWHQALLKKAVHNCKLHSLKNTKRETLYELGSLRVQHEQLN